MSSLVSLILESLSNDPPEMLYEQRINNKFPIAFYELFKKFHEKFSSFEIDEDKMTIDISYVSDEYEELKVFIKALSSFSKKENVSVKVKKFDKLNKELLLQVK